MLSLKSEQKVRRLKVLKVHFPFMNHVFIFDVETDKGFNQIPIEHAEYYYSPMLLHKAKYIELWGSAWFSDDFRFRLLFKCDRCKEIIDIHDEMLDLRVTNCNFESCKEENLILCDKCPRDYCKKHDMILTLRKI